jgi:hypothetical protein
VILEGLPSPEKGAGGGEGENKRKIHLKNLSMNIKG